MKNTAAATFRNPLLTVDQVQEILAMTNRRSVYPWLRHHGVPLISGRVSARKFYAVWDDESASFDPVEYVRRMTS